MMNENKWDTILSHIVSDDDYPSFVFKIVGKENATYCDYEKLTLYLERMHPNNKDLLNEFFIKLVKDFNLDIDFDPTSVKDLNGYIDKFLTNNVDNIKEKFDISSALYYDENDKVYKSRLTGGVGLQTKISTAINLEQSTTDVVYGDVISLVAYTTRKLANEYLDFYNDDTNTLIKSAKIGKDGEAVCTFSTTDLAGVHHFRAEFKGNNIYTKIVSDSVMINVLKATPEMDISLINNEVNTIIIVSLSDNYHSLDDSTGFVDVEFNEIQLANSSLTQQDFTSEAQLILYDTQMTLDKVTIRFSGNNCYNELTKEMVL